MVKKGNLHGIQNQSSASKTNKQSRCVILEGFVAYNKI